VQTATTRIQIACALGVKFPRRGHASPRNKELAVMCGLKSENGIAIVLENEDLAPNY